jgi:chromosome segregation ATPase
MPGEGSSSGREQQLVEEIEQWQGCHAALKLDFANSEARVAELDELLRRWYRADGTAETLPTAAEVVLRRVAAAQQLASLQTRVEDLERELAAERQARVRLQHELKNAADGRPFNPEVR